VPVPGWLFQLLFHPKFFRLSAALKRRLAIAWMRRHLAQLLVTVGKTCGAVVPDAAWTSDNGAMVGIAGTEGPIGLDTQIGDAVGISTNMLWKARYEQQNCSLQPLLMQLVDKVHGNLKGVCMWFSFI
jgi:hypothetical protein